MSRLGDFELPDATLSDSIEAVLRAHRAFGQSFSRDSFAGLLQLRGRGGWFAALLGSIRLWGLAEGRGTLRLTANGVRLARAASPGVVSESRRVAARTVPLVKEIYDRSQGRLPARTDLALMLAEITGADAGRIHSSLPQVRRIIADSLAADPNPLSPSVARDGSERHGEPSIGPGHERAPAGPIHDRIAMIEVSFSGGKLSLPETAANLELAASLLMRRAADLSGKG